MAKSKKKNKKRRVIVKAGYTPGFSLSPTYTAKRKRKVEERKR